MPLGTAWEGYVAQNKANQDEATAQLHRSAGTLGILSTIQAQQREAQLRGVLSSLPPDATPEMVTRTITPYVGGDVLMKVLTSSQDRQAQIKATQENARSRVTQAFQLADIQHQDRMRNATTTEARASETARHNTVVEALQRDAVTNTGARLQYETGMAPANSGVLSATPVPQGALSRFGPPETPEPMASINANLPEGGMRLSNLPMAQINELASRDPTFAGILSKIQAAQPSASVAPPPTAPQLAQAPAVTPVAAQVSPAAVPTAPGVAPSASPVERAIVTMPPEIARLPKKQQDAWMVQNAGGGIEQTAKGIANYDIAPLSSFAMARPFGAQVMGRVMELNPTYDAKQFQVRKGAEIAFTSGKQGNTVRSFNVALVHLNTLDRLAGALGNNDIQQVNRLAQEVSQQTGSPAPVTFDAAKKIVGDEIVKAIVGAGGGVSDREEAGKSISRTNSPAQLKGVIATYKELMRGQLSGLEKQYEASTQKKDFRTRFLSDVARTEVGGSPTQGTVDQLLEKYK